MARKNYTEEQKKSAVDKAKKIGVVKAANELGISASTLTIWSKAQTKPEEKAPAPIKEKVKKTRKSKKDSPETKRLLALEEENRELSTTNMKLKAERDQLKKAIRDIID